MKEEVKAKVQNKVKSPEEKEKIISRKSLRAVLEQSNVMRKPNEERMRYQKCKAHAMLMETANYDKIIVFPSIDAPWYKIGGNSVLFYAYDIAPATFKNKELPTVRPDTDNGIRSDDGIVFVRNIEALIKRLEKAEITKYEVLDDGIYVFQLAREYTKTEVKGLRQIRYQKGNELEDMAVPKRVYPELRGEIVKAIRMVMPKAKKMDEFYRNTMGMSIAGAVLEMNRVYLELANGRMKFADALTKIVENANVVLEMLVVIKEVDAWNPVTLVEVGSLMVDIKVAVKKIINKSNEKAN